MVIHEVDIEGVAVFKPEDDVEDVTAAELEAAVRYVLGRAGKQQI